MRFDERYRETAALSDGSRVTLRLVRRSDKDLLRRGFERLSPVSRYRRFFAVKPELTDSEVKYLTDIDGHDHFAIGALSEGPGGREEGVGIARFIRSKQDPQAAEVAVVVVDDWQRRGLGTLLLLRLVAAARERSIERFAGQVLASNLAIRDILGHLEHGVRLGAVDGQIDVEIDLPEVPFDAAPIPQDRETPLHRLFALIARGLLHVRNAVESLSPHASEGDRGAPAPPPPREHTGDER